MGISQPAGRLGWRTKRQRKISGWTRTMDERGCWGRNDRATRTHARLLQLHKFDSLRICVIVGSGSERTVMLVHHSCTAPHVLIVASEIHDARQSAEDCAVAVRVNDAGPRSALGTLPHLAARKSTRRWREQDWEGKRRTCEWCWRLVGSISRSGHDIRL